ncbi:MAG: hypothetical protein JNIBNLAF_00103 [Nitrosomonas europaea]|uniref:DGQHR domain-containing protein n=1 Tax=Nitrosomonas TaxID=914 RepID=UPI0023F4341E|nr:MULTISPECIES: DGQHR domain-containing protein [Nitrosomonas]MBV6388510.1 hypothetical protein [Nitrosomonas europaea]
MSDANRNRTVPALKVNQWLDCWNDIKWGENERGAEPQHWFYQFSMSARDLKALSGIYPRTTQRAKGSDDYGIQRKHESSRSEEIKKFIQFGYPWSDLSEKKRNSGDFDELKRPGWLPTAIVVNVLTENESRRGITIGTNDLIKIKDDDNNRLSSIHLPDGFDGPSWRSNTLPPIEVIDGQHRLWAFDNLDLQGDFELPVIAFVGLDLRWQAYLFYTINVKPKKINASLAFDLYPLLRTQEWLTKFEGHAIYRETRAQEIVDLLWSCEESPWYHRINMLGEPGSKGKMVAQAAWIRSLLSSFIKSWEGPGVKVGGLFGAPVGQHETVLPWTRAEQAAFIIFAGQMIRKAISECNADWAEALRNQKELSLFGEDDAAFYGSKSLINQDQGIRVFLQIVNDLFYISSDQLNLQCWGGQHSEESEDQEIIKERVVSLHSEAAISQFMTTLVESLAKFDWRSSDAPGLGDQARTLKASFRGSSGYKDLRRHVLKHLTEEDGDVTSSAQRVLELLGY